MLLGGIKIGPPRTALWDHLGDKKYMDRNVMTNDLEAKDQELTETLSVEVILELS